MKEKISTPLYNKLIEHYGNEPISFHVPGHKMGKGFNPLGSYYYQEVLKIDVTEITGLDDLHHPEGVILEAQKRATKLFGADHTFFLVNGSTTGNLAMILTICQPNDKIIVQRDVHKSVLHGLMLARAKPIYISTEIIDELGISGGIHLQQLKDILEANPDAKAIFVTNPNYYGIGINLAKVAELAHAHQIPLLVDEAHGAHYGFHPKFPISAIQSGADIAVQSTHKTLSAMTMGSMLHVKSQYIDIDRLKLFLSMLQSSSPSYPIMASLELTCDWLETNGEELWHHQLKKIDWLYHQSLTFKHIKIKHEFDEHHVIDPLKIIINSKVANITGYFIQKYLERKGIFPELADRDNTLIIVTFGNDEEDIDYLYRRLKELDNHISFLLQTNQIEERGKTPHSHLILSKESKISMEKILYGEKEDVPLEEAIGKISAGMVIPYPPGIPIILFGEEISEETIRYIIDLQKKGAKIQGIYNKRLIKILKNDTYNI